MPRTIQEINEKIKAGKAVVVTAEEITGIVKKKGVEKAYRRGGCGNHRYLWPHVFEWDLSQYRSYQAAG